MIRPDKHTNPALSVVQVAGIILTEIKQGEIIPYGDLLTTVNSQTPISIKEIFNYSLSFLYLLDKVEYIEDFDAIRMKS